MDDLFITTHYKVLKLISANMACTENREYCIATQEDIAKELKVTRVTVNKVFSDLKNHGYIESVLHGKWKLTEEGKKAIKIGM